MYSIFVPICTYASLHTVSSFHNSETYTCLLLCVVTVPAHSDLRLCFPLHVHVPVLQDEPADSSAQHFPANNFHPFVQGDEENGLISASGRSNFISVSKWAFSCVSFCTISKSFCRRFIFLLLFMKMARTFWFFFLFGRQSGAFCPLHFTLAQSPIVRERWYFPLGLLEKCWYFLTPPHKDHSLHFNGF